MEIEKCGRQRQRAGMEDTDGAAVIARGEELSDVILAGREGDIEESGLERADDAGGDAAFSDLDDFIDDAAGFFLTYQK